jgi:hypothetical protein
LPAIKLTKRVFLSSDSGKEYSKQTSTLMAMPVSGPAVHRHLRGYHKSFPWFVVSPILSFPDFEGAELHYGTPDKELVFGGK